MTHTSSKAAACDTRKNRANLYEEITIKIMAELEAGRVPWVQPWEFSAVRRRSTGDLPKSRPRWLSLRNGRSSTT